MSFRPFSGLILTLVIILIDLQSLDGASPTSKKSGNLTVPSPSASEKRERIFLGNGGFSLGFSKYHGGVYPFGGGGFGFGGSFLGGGHYHHNHGFGYGGGFSPAFGYNGGLGGWGGYNPYYSPTLGAGGFIGGGSYGFKHHHGYGHYNHHLGYGGLGGFGYH